MFLLNQHLATATHKTNEAICLSRESEIPEAILEIQREVEEKYPRVFSFHKTSIFCRSCNLQFSAKHKVVLSNIKQHVDSRGHKEKTGKTKAASSKDISSFFTRKTLVWENDVILGLRVLREMIYNSTKRIICIHKGSACCGLSCKDFEFTAAMKRKSKQCFNLEENLKLYSNGKKILCRYFFKTQEGSENWHKPRRKANVVALARKPMCEITCVPIFIGTDLRRGGGRGLGEFARTSQI